MSEGSEPVKSEEEKEVGSSEEEEKDEKEEDVKKNSTPKKAVAKKDPETAATNKSSKPPKKAEPKESEDEEAEEEEKKIGLLDLPVELSGTRERKKVQRLDVSFPTPAKVDFPEGKGTKLGDCPRIEHGLGRTPTDELKNLHRILYNRPGTSSEIKRNIRRFSGFSFDKNVPEFERKRGLMEKINVSGLKLICEIMDLERGGTKDEITSRILDFLICPQPSGKKVPAAKKRGAMTGKGTKRKSSGDKKSMKQPATKRKKKNSSDSEEDNDDDNEKMEEDEEEQESEKSDNDDNEVEEEEEKPKPKKRAPPKKKAKPKDSSEDEPEDDEDEKDEEPKPKPKKRAPPKKKPKRKDSSEDEAEKDGEGKGDAEDGEGDDSDPDEQPINKNAKGATTKKAAPVKSVRKKNNTKAETAKPAKKSKKEESAEELDSDNETLSNKVKGPPNNEEIEQEIKKILEGANLEEITMKKVIKEICDLYPNHDLADKKDFIKTTVKSLIS